MNLFICMNPKCGNVSDFHTVISGLDTNKEFPNMLQDDMLGKGGVRINIATIKPITVWKDPNDILMLCNECNTGVKSNPLKIAPTLNDIAVAKESVYNMITPYDHPKGKIVPDETSGRYRVVTEEEFDEYVSKRKKYTEFMHGVMTVVPEARNMLYPRRNVKTDTSDKRVKIKLAEYRRQWKQAKRDKDVVKVRLLKDKMNSLL